MITLDSLFTAVSFGHGAVADTGTRGRSPRAALLGGSRILFDFLKNYLGKVPPLYVSKQYNAAETI